jgi:predicted MFS family arabinose efflux permease
MTAGRSGDARIVAAMVIDSAGSGLWLPFSLLYFVYGRGMPLPAVGTALTAGALVGVGVGGIAAGSLTDRLGSRSASALSSLVRAVAFPFYVLTNGPVAVSVVAAFISFGDRLFWASNAGVVAAFHPDLTGRMRLFARLNRVRFVGMSVGALAVTTGVAVQGIRSPWLYAVVLYLNAVSFLAAACLIFASGRTSRPSPPTCRQAAKARDDPSLRGAKTSYREVLRNQSFVQYTAINFVFALASDSFTTALPIFLIRYAGEPAWTPGALYLVSCITLLASRPLVNSMATKSQPHRLQRLAAGLSALYFVALPLVPMLGPVFGLVLALALTMLFALSEAVQAMVMSAIVLEFAPPTAQGRYNAFFQLSWGLAGALAPGVYAFGLTLSPAGLWVALALLTAAGGVVLGRIRFPARTDEHRFPTRS